MMIVCSKETRHTFVDIMVAAGGITSTCKPEENRIFREARRNPNELANNPRRHVGSRG